MIFDCPIIHHHHDLFHQANNFFLISKGKYTNQTGHFGHDLQAVDLFFNIPSLLLTFSVEAMGKCYFCAVGG
jgi:hypothetical protein